MNKKEECAVFKDLYELYMDKELEQESMIWMEKHKQTCPQCINLGDEQVIFPERFNEDQEKIWSILIINFILYGSFIVLSIWMSVWYFW